MARCYSIVGVRTWSGDLPDSRVMAGNDSIALATPYLSEGQRASRKAGRGPGKPLSLK